MMAFPITEFKKRTFWAVVQSEDGRVIAEVELLALSYMRWNELGFLVPAPVAPVIKDPKDLTKVIPDLKKQRELDAEAEMKRNAIRLVVSLEGGSGIDWNGVEPDTLEDKADELMQVDSLVFLGLLQCLQKRIFGAGVTTEESADRFQRLQANGHAGQQPPTNVDQPDHQSAGVGETDSV